MLENIGLIPLFPLIGFVLNGLFGKYFKKSWISFIGVGSVGLSFVLALKIFSELIGLPETERIIEIFSFPWIYSGNLNVDVSFLLDPLSMVMVLVVTGVGFLIHLYSVGYMGQDTGYARYFSYMNLFTFSMLVLVLANNFLFMYVGWELVGLCSYLLIGFWYERKSAADAGKKAFIVNRIGDFGFALGIMLIFWNLGTLNFTEVFHKAPEMLVAGGGVVTAITLLLFTGAIGKSAQIPLYVWLPDAMEGPTPVSALIHAATMVTAGVYLVARCHVLYLMAPASLLVVAIIGGITAVYAASIGLVQNDIKRILAYSTISQIGYMLLACGVAAFAAGIFHLMTHAFFKALLFLAAGSVIHALHGEQDIRHMGGLKKNLPLTYWTFLFGALAISGIPVFSGFFSKDEILWKTFSSPQGSKILWLLALLGAGMTAFYMFRLTFVTFLGQTKPGAEKSHQVHEAPPTMAIALVVLAFLSLVGGFIGIPASLGGNNAFEHFLSPVFEEKRITAGLSPEGTVASASVEYILLILSVFIAMLGLFTAYRLYVRSPLRAEALKSKLKKPYRILLNKYYVDELYGLSVVQPVINFSLWCWRFFDTKIIDGLVNGSAFMVGWFSSVTRKIQTGYVRNYALALGLGSLFVLTYLLFR